MQKVLQRGRRRKIAAKVTSRHQVRVVVARMKSAGWWAIDPENLSDDGRIVKMEDTGYAMGDGPLDARIEFIHKIDQMFLATWGRHIKLPELEYIMDVPAWADRDSDTWPPNLWVDEAATYLGVDPKTIMLLPKDSIETGEQMWGEYKNALLQLDPPDNLIFTSAYEGPSPDRLLQDFRDHMEASVHLHFDDSRKFLEGVPVTTVPNWAKGAAQRVAARFQQKTAGSADFMNYGKGTNPGKIFSDLVDRSQYSSGSEYSGEIGMKDDFKLRRSDPMSMSKARSFARKDIDNTDKWGPAFAVPVAETKVVASKEKTAKVKARDKNSAIATLRKTLEGQRRRAGTDIELVVKKAEMVRAGGKPEMTREKSTQTKAVVWGVEYQAPGSISWVGGDYGIASKLKSKKDAVAKILPALERHSVGTKFRIYQQTTVYGDELTYAAEATRLPTWEITAVVKQVQQGKIEGYLFYGWASS
jgi:hypothetical protein